MTIMSTPGWSTENGVGKERMYDPPDWHGVSPEVLKKRGKPWNQTADSAPWPDHDGAEAKIEAKLKDGLISTEEAELLLQWVIDGYFILKSAVPESDFPL